MISKNEAISLLVRCAPIAAKLATIGGDNNITCEEQAILNRFEEECLSELLYDRDIYRFSGLTLEDIVNLNFLAAMELISNMTIKPIPKDEGFSKSSWRGNTLNLDELFSDGLYI